MAEARSLVSGVADRYAGSLFELARDENLVEAVEADLGRFEALIAESADLERLVRSPVFSAADQERAIAAILERLGVGRLTSNFLRLVARNRRLFVAPGMIRSFRRLAAEHRGETSAEVKSAHALSPDQEQDLKATLKAVAGKDVTIAVTVDPSLLGGLVVKMGSRQIDTSLKSKLASLKLALKEVG